MSLKSKVGKSLIGVLLGLSATTAIVKYNEGYNPAAYKDSAGVWTQCYGETKDVVPGSVKTPIECEKQLQASLKAHGVGLDGLREDTPVVAALGALDMIYNVGVNGFNTSKVKRLMAAGEYTRAGEAVLDWKYITVRVNGKKQKYDCSQFVKGKPNKVCYGVWKRRLWQSKAIGNEFKSVQQALAELPK